MLFVRRTRSGKKKGKLKAMDTGTYISPRPGQYLMLEHSHITAREERTKQIKKKKRSMSSAGCFSLNCIFPRSNNIETTPRLASFIALIRSLIPSFFPAPTYKGESPTSVFLPLNLGIKVVRPILHKL